MVAVEMAAVVLAAAMRVVAMVAVEKVGVDMVGGVGAAMAVVRGLMWGGGRVRAGGGGGGMGEGGVEARGGAKVVVLMGVTEEATEVVVPAVVTEVAAMAGVMEVAAKVVKETVAGATAVEEMVEHRLAGRSLRSRCRKGSGFPSNLIRRQRIVRRLKDTKSWCRL
jgi:hypothetical protein